MDMRHYIRSFNSKEDFVDGSLLIEKQGIESSIFFYTETCETYIITSPDPVILGSLHISELKKLLPKFGKYEIEEFFMNRFLTALLITGDASELFNTTVLCSDSIWSQRLFKEDVRKIFLKKTFSIVSKTCNLVNLKLNLS